MKALLIAACERVISDPEAGSSLISLFHEIKIQIAKDAPDPPSNAVIPQRWAVFVKFELDPNEEGRDYTLVSDIFWPDGTPFLSGYELSAKQPTNNGMAFILNNLGFPMGQPGKISIRTKLMSGGKIVCEPSEVSIIVRVEKIS
jgi:hypothetical protein